MSRSNFIVRGGGDFSKLYQELNNAQKRMNTFKTGISNTMKGITALFGGLAVGKLVKDFASTAMRTETLEVAMNSVARSSGYATDELEKHRQAVRDMGIASQESMQILTRFMQAQLDTADASKLARVAQDAAVIANVNSSEAAEQMTEAIAKQRPELLSAFGMTKNLNVVLKEYADTLGLTVKDLTEAERKQAMLNYILSEGEKIAGTYEASMGAVGKQIGSLPRHWQDLQNAIATPLALPGISVAVQAITNALKNAVVWAEANNDVLAHYGRIVSGVVENTIKGFTWIGQVLSNNWGMIKNLGVALLSYATATKVVAGATAIWSTINSILNGTLSTKIPILGTLSSAVAIYRTQLDVATASATVTTGAMFKLRTALYSVYSAIGPVGWAILGVSALIMGAMGLWGKYSNSVMRTNQSIQQSTALTEEQKANLQKSNEALKNMNQNAKLAGQGQNKLADGIKKAEKAAKGSLAGFDEINTLQQDMGGASAGGASVPSIDIPDIDIPDIDMPDLGGMDFGGMLDDIEMVKPTLGGFWDWIKTGFSNAWEKVKTSASLANWFIRNRFSESWKKIKETFAGIGGWFADRYTDIKNAFGLMGQWFGAKSKEAMTKIKKTFIGIGGWFVDRYNDVTKAFSLMGTWFKAKFTEAKNNIVNVFKSIGSWFGDRWQDIKNVYAVADFWFKTKFDNAMKKIKQSFANIGSWFGNRYNDIKGVFNNIGNWFGEKFGGAYARMRQIFSLGNVRSTFTIALNGIKGVFGGIPAWFQTTFYRAWNNVKNVFSSGGKIFTGIKDGIASTFRTIVNGLISGINRVIRVPFNKINSMLNTIRNVSFLGISPFKNLWKQSPLSIPQIPRLAQGGYIGANKPLLAMIGDNRHEGEIVAPESKLYEQTFKAITDALGNNSGGSQEIVINFGGTEIYRKIINGINSTQKQAGRTLLNV